MKQVFISYSRNDSIFAKRLLTDLEERLTDVRIFYDGYLSPGEIWINVLATEIEKSDIFLAIYSQDYFDSKWSTREFNLALSRQPELHIIPLICKECKPDGFYKLLTWIDFCINYQLSLTLLHYTIIKKCGCDIGTEFPKFTQILNKSIENLVSNSQDHHKKGQQEAAERCLHEAEELIESLEKFKNINPREKSLDEEIRQIASSEKKIIAYWKKVIKADLSTDETQQSKKPINTEYENKNASIVKLTDNPQVFFKRWLSKPDVMLQEFYKLLKKPSGLEIIQTISKTKMTDLSEDIFELCKESGLNQERAQNRGESIIRFAKSYASLHHTTEKEIILSQVDDICKELRIIQGQLQHIGIDIRQVNALKFFFKSLEQIYTDDFPDKIDFNFDMKNHQAIPSEEIKDLINKAKEGFHGGSLEEMENILTDFIHYCDEIYPNWIESRLMKTAAKIKLTILNANKIKSIFICYSQKDMKIKKDLEFQLENLKQNHIKVWSDKDVDSGERYKSVILEAIKSSTIAICLISEDFLKSEFISDTELPEILKRYKANKLIIFPVLVRSCDVSIIDWLRGLQIYPDDQNPLSMFLDEELKEKLIEITRRIANIFKKKYHQMKSLASQI